MARQDDPDPLRSGEVRRSPTGRVPHWVLDEALGRPVQPVPFRAAPRATVRARSRGAWRSRAVTTLLVGALVGAGWWVRDPLGQRAGAPVVLASGAAQRQGPPPGQEEAGARPTRAAAQEGAGFRYLAHQADGRSPIGWSPCRPVHYVVRADHAPPGGAQLLAEAVAAVSTATGLRFVADGPTQEGPLEDRPAYQPDRYGDRWAPVLVTWATPDEVPDFGVDIAGEAGPVPATTPSGDKTFVSGAVALDPASISRLTVTAGRDAARSVVLHELGHLVGLAHVNDRTQVMFPRVGQSAGYGPGDLAGLTSVGATACQPDG